MSHLRVSLSNGKTLNDTVKSVIVSVGSASNTWENAQADLMIAGELNHHELIQCAHNGQTVILTDHSNTERCFFNEFKQRFTQMIMPEYSAANFEIIISTVDRDPIQYA